MPSSQYSQLELHIAHNTEFVHHHSSYFNGCLPTELYANILQHLNDIIQPRETSYAMYQCALVCHTWSQLVLDYKFLHIVRLPSLYSLIKYEAVVRKHRKHPLPVQKLVFRTMGDLSHANRCPNRRTYECPKLRTHECPTPLRHESPSPFTRIFPLIRRFPRLLELHIEIMQFGDEHPRLFEIARNTSIQTLRLYSAAVVPLTPLIRLLRCFQSLFTLDLQLDVNSETVVSIPPILYKRKCSLTALVLQPRSASDDPAHWSLISWMAKAVGLASGLQKLELKFRDKYANSEFWDSVEELLDCCCQSLKILKISSESSSSERRLSCSATCSHRVGGCQLLAEHSNRLMNSS